MAVLRADSDVLIPLDFEEKAIYPSHTLEQASKELIKKDSFMMPKSGSIASMFALFAISQLAGAASIYKWYDESGQVNYTQTPPPKTAIRVEKPGGHINVLEQNWSSDMERHTRKFMNDAKAKGVWVE